MEPQRIARAFIEPCVKSCVDGVEHDDMALGDGGGIMKVYGQVRGFLESVEWGHGGGGRKRRQISSIC